QSDSHSSWDICSSVLTFQNGACATIGADYSDGLRIERDWLVRAGSVTICTGQGFTTIRVSSVPIAGDVIRTRSPGLRNRSGARFPSANLGLESAAVPAAVPPLMMSPGYKVRSRDRYSMYSQNENTISRVLYRCRLSPFTQ